MTRPAWIVRGALLASLLLHGLLLALLFALPGLGRPPQRVSVYTVRVVEVSAADGSQVASGDGLAPGLHQSSPLAPAAQAASTAATAKATRPPHPTPQAESRAAAADATPAYESSLASAPAPQPAPPPPRKVTPQTAAGLAPDAVAVQQAPLEPSAVPQPPPGPEPVAMDAPPRAPEPTAQAAATAAPVRPPESSDPSTAIVAAAMTTSPGPAPAPAPDAAAQRQAVSTGEAPMVPPTATHAALPGPGDGSRSGPESLAAATDHARAGRDAPSGAGTGGAAGAVGPPLVDVQTLDAGFRLMTPVEPRYPEQARRLGRAGTVRLELDIGPDGQVTRITVQDASPGWGFGAAARAAFAHARFTPPRLHGEPVRVRWRRTLHFRP